MREFLVYAVRCCWRSSNVRGFGVCCTVLLGELKIHEVLLHATMLEEPKRARFWGILYGRAAGARTREILGCTALLLEELKCLRVWSTVLLGGAPPLESLVCMVMFCRTSTRPLRLPCADNQPGGGERGGTPARREESTCSLLFLAVEAVVLTV